jgi:hypothetical protein
MSEEVLDIKFRTSTQDDKDIITYNIGGRYEGIFIDKDGKLAGSITGDLTESLKNNTTMLGIYKNYLYQNSLSTKFANAASSVGQRVSSVGQGLKTAMTPIKEGLSKTNFGFMKQFKTYQDSQSKGGKTKSKRSANANKTLKNRK